MPLTLDPNKSALLEKCAVFVAVAVVVQVTISLILPYVAVRMGIQLVDSDRALISQVVSAIINVFLLIVGFFFGASVGNRQKDETISTLTSTNAKAQDVLMPTTKPDVTIPPGGSATVAATPEGS